VESRAIDFERARADESYRAELYKHLERGGILVLDAGDSQFLPVGPSADYLRAQAQSRNAAHKNIAYKPRQGKVTGAAAGDERLHTILAAYSRGAMAAMAELFPRYAGRWTVDYASFRPFEEEGRQLPMKRRNDLLHVDAFPTRPTGGGNILRLFTNLHTTRDRVWVTSGSFEEVAATHAGGAVMERVLGVGGALRRGFARAAAGVGAPVTVRCPYDEIMLRLHDALKADEAFQRTGRRDEHRFGPGQSWISFTDRLGHAVVSGQYALEQTCIVPCESLAHPEWSPAAVLERLSGRRLRPGTEAKLPERQMARGPDREIGRKRDAAIPGKLAATSRETRGPGGRGAGDADDSGRGGRAGRGVANPDVSPQRRV
jgi:hypothetical protein